jgi:hypothetical protein
MCANAFSMNKNLIKYGVRMINAVLEGLYFPNA